MNAPAGRPPASARYRASVCGSILILMIVLAGCGARDDARGSSNADVRLTLEPATAVVGPSRITIQLTDESNTPRAGATIRVEGTMRHAGMAPVIRDAIEVSAGQYSVEDFEFTMAGDWVLIISGTTSDGDSITTQVDIGTVGIGSSSPDAPLIPSVRCHSTPTPSTGE